MGSTRTPQTPMAFTRAEFWKGAVAAWLFFLALFTGVALVLAANSDNTPWAYRGPLVSFSILIAAVISGIVLLVAAPLIRRLAWRLRTQRSLWVHALAYAASGAGIAVLTLLMLQICFAVMWSSAVPLEMFGLYCLVAAALTAASLILGWGVAVHAARRADQREASVRFVQR